VLPSLRPHLTAQAGLDFLPYRQSTPEFCRSTLGEAQQAFSPVPARAFCDPAPPAHDFQSPSQGSAVHRQHCAELPLADLSGARENLQDGELGGPQPKRAKRLFIMMGQCSRGAAEAAAHAP